MNSRRSSQTWEPGHHPHRGQPTEERRPGNAGGGGIPGGEGSSQSGLFMQTHLGAGPPSAAGGVTLPRVQVGVVGNSRRWRNGESWPCCGQVRGGQRTTASVGSYLHSAQNNPYAQVAYFGVAYSDPLTCLASLACLYMTAFRWVVCKALPPPALPHHSGVL